ncbi:TolC family protein [Spirosoma spitsbergense]|uniref:TolC family protein n=1 Tax=Spirosoma spitsbergense TaxID=431554 RepID=UPI00038188C5|nr:TolC family protein [Spirosoma spitsbergense]
MNSENSANLMYWRHPIKAVVSRLPWLISCVFFVLTNSLSQAQSVLPLDSILVRIDQDNPLLKPYGSRAAAARAYAEGARSWMAPMVGLGTFMMPYPGQTVEAQNRGNIMVAAEQDIPNGAKQRATQVYQQSKAAIEEASRGVTLNQLRSDARQLYYDWLVLGKQRTILLENQRILQLAKKLADIRYPYQQGSLGSIYKAQGRLDELANMLIMNESNAVRKRIGLNTLMNRSKTDTFQIDTTYRPQEPGLMLPTTEEIGEARSDIQRIDRQILSMQAGIEAQRAQVKPDLRLSFSHMSPLSRMMPQMFTAMGMISIPIVPWASRGYKAEIKGMQLDIQAMRAEREGMLNDTQGMVAQMLTDIRALRTQLGNYETRIIPALRRNYDTQLIAYEQNKSELPLVIDAWETLNMTQMDYLNRLQDYYRMIVSYEKELEK